MTRAKAALAGLTRDTLLVGDRLYCTVDFFAAVQAQGCWGLFRRNRLVGLHRLQRLRKRRHAGGCLEDWLVRAGSGVSAPIQTLCYIRWRQGGTRYELLTNVSELTRLAAEEALLLYPARWRIERMYFDLKEVLNLNRISAANPHAVAMQVYAAGLVYNVMRVAQSEVGETAGIEPEEISPAKFYPKLAAACHSYVVSQAMVHDIRRLNPRTRLRLPDWRTRRCASVPLAAIRVERRNGSRRKRRYCPARRHWKSFVHVRGGRKFVRLS
ncbi:MAG: transposase [Candidatus Rokubacteria bacterium]|nr:transposase [Candidatus Rokubacteria bacterium]